MVASCMATGSYFAAEPIPSSLREVWRDPTVRRRIVEYLGGDDIESATASFIGRLDPSDPSVFERHPPQDLDSMLSEGCEMARSLEDRHSMLIHLDIEYVNFDDPALAYLDAARVFRLQEPLVHAIETRLLAFGIHCLHLVTGQGHHFVWRIPKNSRIALMIADLDPSATPTGGSSAAERCFQNLALVMEYFAHLVKRDASQCCEVPVEITAQHVGPGVFGMREMLSIDLSEYGDPLHSRMIRIPYTTYRKPWVSGLINRLGLDDSVNEFCTLPLHEMDLSTLLGQRHLTECVLGMARRAGVEIPLQESGTENLLHDYLASDLRSFHQSYYAVPQKAPPGIRATDGLPPCAVHVLAAANDWLLKPSGIKLLTRCLLAQGWHARQIAGLVWETFEDLAHDWGDRWHEYHPALRADFYVRLFAGQIACGLDAGLDFNCVSQQEIQFCWNPCGCSLEPFLNRLLRSPIPPAFQSPNPPPT